MGRVFSLLGHDITFNEKQLAFVELRGSFETLKDELAGDVERNLKQQISNFSEVPTYHAEAVAKCLSEITNLGIEILCSYGIYEVDEESFQQSLIEGARNQDIFSPIQKLVEEADEIEGIEGSGGLGLIGGGFGAEGALQGMAIAGAVNLLTGALSGAAAAGKRTFARMAATEHLRNPQNLNKIIGTFEELVERGLRQTAQIISSHQPEALQFPSEDDVRHARALIKNLSMGRVAEARRSEVMVSALQKNSYDPAAHALLHSDFELSESSEEFSRFLNIDCRKETGRDGTEEVVLDSESKPIPWVHELREIFEKFSGVHFIVSPNIPRRKLEGARAKYLKKGLATPEGQEEHALTEIGEPVALLDTTFWGGGGTGITFTDKGIAWNEGEAMGLAWSALQALEDNLEATELGFRFFGSELDIDVWISKDDFEEMMVAVLAAHKARSYLT